MGIGILVVVVSAIFVTWSLARSDTRLAHPAQVATRSPLDEAQRILAARYACGDIAPDAYRRMLAILRT
jgi:uncharacterized membrane protein